MLISPREGELDRIATEIEEDLPHPRLISA